MESIALKLTQLVRNFRYQNQYLKKKVVKEKLFIKK